MWTYCKANFPSKIFQIARVKSDHCFSIKVTSWEKKLSGKGWMSDKCTTFNFKPVVQWFYKPLCMKSLIEQ